MSLCCKDKGKANRPSSRETPNQRGVVAPKGPSCVLCPWEAPYRARRRDVYPGPVPKGFLSLGGIWGGGTRQPIPGKPAVKVARGVRRAACADTPPGQQTAWTLGTLASASPVTQSIALRKWWGPMESLRFPRAKTSCSVGVADCWTKTTGGKRGGGWYSPIHPYLRGAVSFGENDSSCGQVLQTGLESGTLADGRNALTS